ANWHGWVGGRPALSTLSCPVGAEEIISKGLISPLVGKLQGEVEEEFQELILDTLVLCLREDATEALNSNVVPILKQKLISTNENIRSKAARALLNVSISRVGKKQVCQFDVIPILVHLLKDPVEHVKSNAAGALMFATVITEGKYAALEAEAINPLLELLRSPMIVARLYATKALTMLAEAPEGRKILQAHVSTLRDMEVEPHEKPQMAEALQRAARIAVSVIKFKP
ncbi:Radial spoke head 14-like protein, partial [Plecturocebus cupreus]